MNQRAIEGAGAPAAARAVAFYLPQFHPVSENDRWWGPGFTEWRNVAKARPLFRGHVQPHIPGELGFYDLRLPETRGTQASLAADAGVEAFCYWHYWFAGRRILQRPFEEVLVSGHPSMSFCLGWANQSWTGVWHGAGDRMLIEQTYPGAEDDRRHFEAVLPAFRDERYFRVDGKPLFYIFKPELLPEPAEFVERWQSMAQKAGLEGLYIVAEVTDLFGGGASYHRPVADGFDVGLYTRLPLDTTRRRWQNQKLVRKILHRPLTYEHSWNPYLPPAGSGLLSAVYPNWDNTPRSGERGVVLERSSPEKFENHVRRTVSFLQDRTSEQRLLFVKSWNEWAEGNYVEPDVLWDRAWLQALRSGLSLPAS